MKREKEILRAYQEQKTKLGNQEHTFMRGAKWADKHPNWISVNDELPPIGAILLVAIPFGGELNVLALSIKDESDLECLSGMTHWMYLPRPPKGGNE